MRSKTTLVRERKITGLCESNNNIVYFIAHYQKSDLSHVKTKDLKKVLEITTSWKTWLEGYRKIAQFSNTEASDVDTTANKKESINL